MIGRVVRAALLVVLASTRALAAETPEPASAGLAASPLDSDPFSSPYVYQNVGRGRKMSVTLQYEAGFGTRDSRNFAQKGIEQGLRARFQPWEFLGIEAFGGIVVGTGDRPSRGQAVSIEVIARALDQRWHYINLDLGAGYVFDYRSAHVPRVRLTLGRSFGRLDLSVSGLLEIPVGKAGRDDVDVMMSVAASYGIRPWFRLGMEIAAEDLEGFSGHDAEGGAKVLVGPTLAVTLPYDLFLKVNAAAVYAHLGNQAFAPGTAMPAWGAMARAAVGWTWH